MLLHIIFGSEIFIISTHHLWYIIKHGSEILITPSFWAFYSSSGSLILMGHHSVLSPHVGPFVI